MDALKDLSISVNYDANQSAEEAISLRNPLHHASEGDAFTDPKYIVIWCVSLVLLLVVLTVVGSLIVWRKTVMDHMKSWFSQPSAPAYRSFEPARKSVDSYSKETNPNQRELIIDIPPDDLPQKDSTMLQVV